MKINFMSWNTHLYMQGNCINKKQEIINEQKVDNILRVIKEHMDKGNSKDNEYSIAILQEIPYKINKKYKRGTYDIQKWDKHPIFNKLISLFPAKNYDVFYDESYE